MIVALWLLAAAPSGAVVAAEPLDALRAFQAAPFVKAPPPPAPRGAAAIRKALSFEGVEWPAGLSDDDKRAFELALDVSGSFEGPDAWSTITGDFDGQGLSLGLLNQCLGQGSLQPLLLALRARQPDVFSASFSPEHLKSVGGMLDAWKKARGAAALAEGDGGRLSPLDEPGFGADAAGPRANAASVAWAARTLYKGGAFDPAWKAELTGLAARPEYVSLQIAAALGYHEKALAYEAAIGVREARAYLMLFDVVVQDGGLYPEDLADYAAWAKGAPKASDVEKLDKVLELRLRRVRDRFKPDVASRKKAIVDGTGVVHGERRDLPSEYGYDPLWAYK